VGGGITFYNENYVKRIDTLWGQNAKFLSVIVVRIVTTELEIFDESDPSCLKVICFCFVTSYLLKYDDC
jgi:hypothetical protein